MRLNTTELSSYDRAGFLLAADAFSASEIALLKAEMPGLLAEDSPRRVLEKDGRTVRALHGVHATNDVFGRLVRDPRLLEPARQILGSDVYVHQFKINIKAAFEGDVWKWHQDFIFWLKQDGMQEPRAINAMVFLDAVTEFNGPLYLIPGSQRAGVIDVAAHSSGDWQSSFAADLKYSIPRDTLEGLVSSDGLAAPKGDAGSVLFTHCNLVHGSPPNMSPFDRMLVIVTYNSVDNPLRPVPAPRPEFLVSRDFEPLVAVDGPLTAPPAAGR
jgi:hypothetical protein